MKRLTIVAVLLLGGLSGPSVHTATPTIAPQNLQSFVGKYPSALLRDVPSVRNAFLARRYQGW